MVTMVTRDLVPDTHAGRACAPAVRAVAISTEILVVWTLGPSASSVTAALDMQVCLFRLYVMCANYHRNLPA